MDVEKIGQALVTLVVISRHLGHESIADTATDYLLPHAERFGFSPEMCWVLDAVTRAPRDVLTDEQYHALIQATLANLPALPSLR
jgi:hypothetical protein